MAGLIDTVKLAGTLVLAIPAAIAGLELFVRGETVIGAILVILAVVLVVAQRRVTLPSDAKSVAAKRAVGAVTSDPDSAAEESTDSPESNTDTNTK